MRTWLNILLFATLAASLALNFTLSRRADQPNYRFLPEMVDSPAYAAFDTNPNFADAKTLQPPLPGTIARGHKPLHYQATPEDAARAGRELTNPLAHSDSATVNRGRQLFASFCQSCHGSAGNGDGPVAQRGFPPPPPLAGDRARSMADGQIFHVLTHGQGNMPSHASQISPADRWSLVVYVRSLQAEKSGVAPAAKEAQ